MPPSTWEIFTLYNIIYFLYDKPTFYFDLKSQNLFAIQRILEGVDSHHTAKGPLNLPAQI